MVLKIRKDLENKRRKKYTSLLTAFLVNSVFPIPAHGDNERAFLNGTAFLLFILIRGVYFI